MLSTPVVSIQAMNPSVSMDYKGQSSFGKMRNVLQVLIAADLAVADGKLSQIMGTEALGSFNLPKVMLV